MEQEIARRNLDITSLQNPRVKHIVKLRDDKRTRKEDGLMLVEGFDEIQLAVAAGHKPQTLLRFDFTVKEADGSAQREPELVSRTISGLSAETLTVSRAVFEKISYRENPDGWLAIFPIPQRTFETLESEHLLSEVPLILVAESIEKPGNLGAILRTADAAHVDAVLLCDPRVDLWNPNVVRASRGAVFSVPVVEEDNASAWEWLKTRKHALSGVEAMRLFAASPSAKEVYSDVDLRGPLAIAVGTEDEGLSDFWMQRANVKVKIPMFGRVNSLNVSVSTAVIVYEVIRQRGTK